MFQGGLGPVGPRFSVDTGITVEYLDEDRRVVERALPLDVSVIALSTVLHRYPPVGSSVVVELSDAGVDGAPWRVRGIVRDVRPADGEGFRVAIEVRADKPSYGAKELPEGSSAP